MASVSPSIFAILKPHCIELNEACTRLRSGPALGAGVVRPLEGLLQALLDVRGSGRFMDAKIAEYVFFPLSGVFRERQAVPIKALELSCQCLQVLLDTGWRTAVVPDLGVQLMILLTFLADSNTVKKNPSAKVSDDLSFYAFSCLKAVFQGLSRVSASLDALTATKNVPALGHAVAVMLDGSEASESTKTQLAALQALQSFFVCIKDRSVTSSVLPGIVSTLTKIVTPSTQRRRSFRVLQAALSILTSVLQLAMADDVALPAAKEIKEGELSEAWLKATAAQLKMALASIVKIKAHERQEVREQLRRLCIMILQQCPESLHDSKTMALETVMTLAEIEVERDEGSATKTEISSLLFMREDLAESLRESLYHWVVSLPRVMLANDESAKTRIAGLVVTTHNLIVSSELDMTTIDNLFFNNLVEIATHAFAEPENDKLALDISAQIVATTSSSSLLLKDSLDKMPFPCIIKPGSRGFSMMEHMNHILEQHTTSSQTSLIRAGQFLDASRTGSAAQQAAYLWLSLNILKVWDKDNPFVFLHAEVDTENDGARKYREDLYKEALNILREADGSMDVDWKKQALALQSIAYYGSKVTFRFKTEFIDSLYPIVQLIASDHPQLRQSAVACLHSLADSTDYTNVMELLLDNIDYLIDAIGIKLNTQDIQPQTPQVFLAIVKLGGRQIIPYVEDLIESIYQALEAFHGYPVLVESLFKVLNTIVEEGVKDIDSWPLISANPVHQTTVAAPRGRDRLLQHFQAKSDQKIARLNRFQRSDEQNPPSPRLAWAQISAGNQGASDSEATGQPVTRNAESADAIEVEPRVPNEESAEAEPTPSNVSTELKSPLTTTYDTLLRIAQLTQHYLPSSSPGLRNMLLSLINKALPFLSRHKDTYLPLINTLWPVLVPRLDDHEAFVVASVLEVMGVMCQTAGTFMTSRIMQIWPKVMRIYRRRAEGKDIANYEAQVVAEGTLRSSFPSLLFNEEDAALGLRDAAENESMTALPTPAAHGGAYQATTVRRLRAALEAFSTQVLNCTEVPAAIRSDILGGLLLRFVQQGLAGGRPGVSAPEAHAGAAQAALEGDNADAAWFLRQCLRFRGSEERKLLQPLKKLLRKRRPGEVEGGELGGVPASFLDDQGVRWPLIELDMP